MMQHKIDVIWQALESSAAAIKRQSLGALFEQDENRAKTFSLAFDQLYLDYSKQFVNEAIKKAWIELAHACDLSQWIAKLQSGERINFTENRAVMHSTLRAPEHDLSPLWTLIERLQNRQWQGATQQPIEHVVNIGIGGSDLGPRMACSALKNFTVSHLNIHFVSNIDPDEIEHILASLNPHTTLFIISSKSFSTPETLMNAQTAKRWLQCHLDDTLPHFMAITSQPAKAKAWGVLSENILTFEEGVGGRYSIWSAIGFPLALAIGKVHFESFLSGAHQLDRHFFEAPLEDNMPVLMALIGVWYIRCWQAKTHAILPYSYALRKFPDYLQQLDMESNGKTVQREGLVVSYDTGPIVWGQAGTNGQHAFYQLLHQGSHFVPADFILIAKPYYENALQAHQQLLANGLAQTQALMQGTVKTAAHDNMPGNKPTSTLVMNALTPYALGQLIALYEHKVFVQGVIWQINSFDQPGVELGKKLAFEIEKNLKGKPPENKIAGSTARLIEILQQKLAM